MDERELEIRTRSLDTFSFLYSFLRYLLLFRSTAITDHDDYLTWPPNSTGPLAQVSSLWVHWPNFCQTANPLKSPKDGKFPTLYTFLLHSIFKRIFWWSDLFLKEGCPSLTLYDQEITWSLPNSQSKKCSRKVTQGVGYWLFIHHAQGLLSLHIQVVSFFLVAKFGCVHSHSLTGGCETPPWPAIWLMPAIVPTKPGNRTNACTGIRSISWVPCTSHCPLPPWGHGSATNPVNSHVQKYER